ncbi:bifunctional 2-polyprenyl-6-hydroxyphenol methylase/3-demethylubiquinol 3-O-methyltransferase UbiG [Brevundimonas sp. Leaf363]|uniref:class I SAM-dependent methyltransferase n=1 Tax=Brevundimonas sp. Leaf363 TaxID=1736353 RepID=UPI000ACCBC88|nr:class I SAM-dependent methyltransferase [Brevundimonas sp. Leaf363]
MSDAIPAETPEALCADAGRRMAAGDAQGAFRALKASVERHPEHAAAYAPLASLLAGAGHRGQAMEVASRGLSLTGDAAARSPLARVLADSLSSLAPIAWHPRLEADLLACLADPAVDAQRLARVTARTLRLKVDSPVVGDELWLAFLGDCINVDAEMELRLATLRAEATDPDLICALALQAFANEYLLEPVGRAGLAAALDRPLTAPEIAALLPEHGDRPLFRTLLQRSVNEPAEERAIKVSLRRFEGPTDAVSVAVREQYEANPYPRWRVPPPIGPGLRPSLERFGARGRTVLVAGCGTGFEPIDLAQSNPALEITALDLSEASLAYAQRMACGLGLDRIDFVQGDILGVAALGRTFDVITSTGVLHHMDDPAEGLARLAAVLEPGGIMRLALYSRRARGPVRLARDAIAAAGWTATPDGVRALRREVLGRPPGDARTQLALSDDFYSLSGCRDLVFHACEHGYGPLGLPRMAAGAGLVWRGFDLTPPMVQAFRARFGAAADISDPGLWDRLEAAETTLFSEMMHFWLQKPAGGADAACVPPVRA